MILPSRVITGVAASAPEAGAGGIAIGFPVRPVPVANAVSCDLSFRTNAVLPSGVITRANGVPGTLIGRLAVLVAVEIGVTHP
jgi:hypothetical protein